MWRAAYLSSKRDTCVGYNINILLNVSSLRSTVVGELKRPICIVMLHYKLGKPHPATHSSLCSSFRVAGLLLARIYTRSTRITIPFTTSAWLITPSREVISKFNCSTHPATVMMAALSTRLGLLCIETISASTISVQNLRYFIRVKHSYKVVSKSSISFEL